MESLLRVTAAGYANFFGEVFAAEEAEPESKPRQCNDMYTWEGDPYTATPMGVDSDVEHQERAKLLKGTYAQQVVIAETAATPAEVFASFYTGRRSCR